MSLNVAAIWLSHILHLSGNKREVAAVASMNLLSSGARFHH